MFNKKRLLAFAFLWTLIIFVIIAIPGNQIPRVSDWLEAFKPDKIIHVFLFAPFAYLWARYFYLAKASTVLIIVLTLSMGISYAIFTEVMQYYFFIGRNGSIADALSDIIGIIIGMTFYKNGWKKYIINL